MTHANEQYQHLKRFADEMPERGSAFAALEDCAPYNSEVLYCDADGDFYQTDGVPYLGAEEIAAALASGNRSYEFRGLEYQYWIPLPMAFGGGSDD